MEPRKLSALRPINEAIMPGNSLKIRKLCFLETSLLAITRLVHEPRVVLAND